ncbi:hypothetical protein CC86DRAFT_136217 [Ophiobolus disseminans]|uniref:Uncharacterized protein n=1 Tax=Ophiobolus disseminans TaxID=1469910 RepID=A0A6A7AE85_9PLEO|nr:hypothetical protein CC86DRAFT_136217 [Ophiobolus disseminans]
MENPSITQTDRAHKRPRKISWHFPKKILRRFRLYRQAKKQNATPQSLQPAEAPPVSSESRPIVAFSRKELVLKTSTPVKPIAHGTMAADLRRPSIDLWDQVDEKRKEITVRNQHESPFLRLAPEIRNKLYSLILGGRTYRFKDAIDRGHAVLETNGERHVLGLLLVCHQIYSEASLLPYSLNKFSFREFDISLNPFLDHRRLAHFQAITRIELVTYQAEHMWAGSHCDSELLEEVESTRAWERLPNLEEICVIVDLNRSLHIPYGSRDFRFRVIEENQQALEEQVAKWRPLILVRFFWA